MKREHYSKTVLLQGYIELMKPGILMMVLITTLLGFYLGNEGITSWSSLIWTLLGTGLSAGGAGALNQYLEREQDTLMDRTCNRPIPAGLIQPQNALLFGISAVLVGSVVLVWKVNLLTGFLSLLTVFMYVLIYTPMKKVTWLSTSLGSIPGALPPLGGWAAATGSLDPGAWILFAILYLWQHPHFFAIAWMCKDDFKKAGFKMLPVIEPDGTRTMRQIFWHLSLMFPVCFLPFISGMMGNIYLFGATIITLGYFYSAVPMLRAKSLMNASRIFKASLFYLPLLLIIIIIDKGL
ncbi:MAG: heme o synthase [Candidatus Marinimicrobia bacterium]|jgi:protoheme IX farnesyltransferase|nr:heme o synthase [Candidatus Neomarinimicrobiota bacterium]|tara:strand:- start:1077 stop:1958 length:882 start_codon:yes stop_codon:yes gene_type:complete